MHVWPAFVAALGTVLAWLWNALNNSSGAAIVLLTGLLFYVEHRRSRAVIEVRAPHSRTHYRVAFQQMAADEAAWKKARERDTSRGIWFLLQNRGGVDCTIDMSQSYVMLDRRPYKERKSPWWVKRLSRYWQDRANERLARVGRLEFFFKQLQGKRRWQTEGLAVYTQDHWLDMEDRHRPMTLADLQNREPLARELQDITIGSGQAKPYVAEYSLNEKLTGPQPQTRHAILVVRPMIGAPARVRFVAHEIV